MYVSDPNVWRTFYKNMLTGKFNPAQYRGRQTGGGGIAGMYAKKPYMIPVSPHITTEPEEKIVVGQQVSPVTAVEERAKSDLKESIQDKKPHVPVAIKGKTVAKLDRKNLTSVKATLVDKKRKNKASVEGYNIFNKKSRK